jgi:hypothetical protein
MYGASAVICAGRLPVASGGGGFVAFSIAVTALALLVSAGLLVRSLRERAAGEAGDARRFVNRVAIALNVFAIVAILWTAAPLVIHPVCDVQRSS